MTCRFLTWVQYRGNSRGFEITQAPFYPRILTAGEVYIACSGGHKTAVEAFTFNVQAAGVAAAQTVSEVGEDDAEIVC
jgi:hypothetical protein